jgi:ribosomal-protein-alanine N-acetyltransferase
MKITRLNTDTGKSSEFPNEKITDFLYDHLDNFGDTKEAITACIDYVFNPQRGGDIIIASNDGEITGAVILNKTGMSKYIPENILVYIAVHRNYRGHGLGKKLMNEAIKIVEGSIALHVEPDNPARFLYEKLGFTNKYLEMRLIRQ